MNVAVIDGQTIDIGWEIDGQAGAAVVEELAILDRNVRDQVTRITTRLLEFNSGGGACGDNVVDQDVAQSAGNLYSVVAGAAGYVIPDAQEADRDIAGGNRDANPTG